MKDNLLSLTGEIKESVISNKPVYTSLKLIHQIKKNPYYSTLSQSTIGNIQKTEQQLKNAKNVPEKIGQIQRNLFETRNTLRNTGSNFANTGGSDISSITMGSYGTKGTKGSTVTTGSDLLTEFKWKNSVKEMEECINK